MIKVAALTSGQDVPSTRFRVRQHIGRLYDLDIEVVEYYPSISKDAQIPFSHVIGNSVVSLPLKASLAAAKLLATMPGILNGYRADAVWLSRGILLGVPTFERILKHPVILDVDDAIWLRKGRITRGAIYVANSAQAIIAGNEYIADWYSQYSDNVHVIPTAVDADRYKPNEAANGNTFTIGWIGTKHNLKYLQRLEQPLSRFFKEHSNSILLIVSNEAPSFSILDASNIRYVRWSRTDEIKLIQEMDVGLMPLDDNPWTRGKCAFKMLQYMSCGKPVVVSPVGMNAEVLEKDDIGFPALNSEEWYSALSELKQNLPLRKYMGSNARNVVLSHYSSETIITRIADVIRGVI